MSIRTTRFYKLDYRLISSYSVLNGQKYSNNFIDGTLNSNGFTERWDVLL